MPQWVLLSPCPNAMSNFPSVPEISWTLSLDVFLPCSNTSSNIFHRLRSSSLLAKTAIDVDFKSRACALSHPAAEVFSNENITHTPLCWSGCTGPWTRNELEGWWFCIYEMVTWRTSHVVQKYTFIFNTEFSSVLQPSSEPRQFLHRHRIWPVPFTKPPLFQGICSQAAAIPLLKVI